MERGIKFVSEEQSLLPHTAAPRSIDYQFVHRQWLSSCVSFSWFLKWGCLLSQRIKWRCLLLDILKKHTTSHWYYHCCWSIGGLYDLCYFSLYACFLMYKSKTITLFSKYYVQCNCLLNKYQNTSFICDLKNIYCHSISTALTFTENQH